MEEGAAAAADGGEFDRRHDETTAWWQLNGGSAESEQLVDFAPRPSKNSPLLNLLFYLLNFPVAR